MVLLQCMPLSSNGYKKSTSLWKITTTFEVVTIFLEDQWLETLIRMPEEIFLNLSRRANQDVD